MKKKILLSFIFACISIFAFSAISVSATTRGRYNNYLSYYIINNEVTIIDYDSLGPTEVVIPETIENYPVTEIGDEAFMCCYKLKSVQIPNSVKSVGDKAFYSCDSLTSIILSDSTTSIGAQAFEGCRSLKSVTIPDRDCDTIGLNQ